MMFIPDPVSVNEACKKAMKEYAKNYDKCVVACMSDEVLLGMKDLIEKEIKKRDLESEVNQ